MNMRLRRGEGSKNVSLQGKTKEKHYVEKPVSERMDKERKKKKR